MDPGVFQLLQEAEDMEDVIEVDLYNTQALLIMGANSNFYVVNVEIRPEITSAVPNSNKTPVVAGPCIPHHEKGEMR